MPYGVWGFFVPGNPKPTYTQNTRVLYETVLWLLMMHHANVMTWMYSYNK